MSDTKSIETPSSWRSYSLINTEEDLDYFLSELSNQSIYALDTETTSIDTTTNKLVGISIVALPGKAVYIPVGHVDSDRVSLTDQLSLSYLRSKLNPIFEDVGMECVYHNAKFDRHMMSNNGFSLPEKFHDTELIAARLRESDIEGQAKVGLKALTKSLFGHEMGTFVNTFQSAAQKIDKGMWKDVGLAMLSPSDVVHYACEDADFTLGLYFYLREDFIKDAKQWDAYRDEDLPASDALRSIESRGVLIDIDAAKQLIDEAEVKAADVLRDIRSLEYVKSDFNPRSGEQLTKLLYDDLKLPVKRRTRKGNKSTDADTLKKLHDSHEIVPLIERFRNSSSEASKMGQYLKVSPEGRLHTSYRQTLSSGRLSSSSPNIQQLPKTLRHRRCIVADPGKLLIKADYSQLEFRIFADLTQDPEMMRAFNEGVDPHAATAEVVGCTRSQAKVINFGIFYGMGKATLADKLGTSEAEAWGFKESFLNTYVDARLWLEQQGMACDRVGYAVTRGGRKRYLKDWDKTVTAAFNHPVQGGAAELVNRAMIELERVQPYGAEILLQAHDEFLLRVDEDNAEQAAAAVSTIMTDPDVVGQYAVPMSVEAQIGSNWAMSDPASV